MNSNKLPHEINPNKCIIEGFEILAFEKEDELDYYSIWHETLFDKRRELKAETERERQIIIDETIRKTSSFLLGTRESVRNQRCAKKLKTLDNLSPLKQSYGAELTQAQQQQQQHQQQQHAQLQANDDTSTSRSKRAPVANRSTPKSASKELQANNSALKALETARHFPVPLQPASRLPKPGTATLPNGLTILNSSYYKTLPSNKEIMKYKLTKLYNKYRGRQIRRNYVHEKQRLAKIDAEVSKSYLNSWLAYTALQALRLPDKNLNQLSAVTNNATKFLTTIAPQTQTTQSLETVAAGTVGSASKKFKIAPSNKSQQQNQSTSSSSQQTPQQQQPLPSNHMGAPPMHLVYIDPCNIITYSNKINPQQVADYRRKSHLLPSTSMSKKSSAASYDVFEIMDVLANTNKVNVSITRNANRPAAPGCSVYSHSVNANNQGIVSTQLHLQAKYYLDSVAKIYHEEAQRLEQDKEALKTEPTPEEMVGKYLRLDLPYDKNNINNNGNGNSNTNNNQRQGDNLNSSGDSLNDDFNQSGLKQETDQEQEDELEKLEEDIKNSNLMMMI